MVLSVVQGVLEEFGTGPREWYEDLTLRARMFQDVQMLVILVAGSRGH